MSDTVLQFEKCYIDSIKIVINHRIQEDLLLNYGVFFKEIASDLEAEIKINQVIDPMPPEISRITIVGKETVLDFGLNRIEINIKGNRKHVRKEDLFLGYKHRLNEIDSLLQNYLSKLEGKQGFVGIIAPVRFPQPINISKDVLIKKLYEIFVGSVNFDLAAFSFKIGLKIADIFENFEISDYEVKNVNISPSLPVIRSQLISMISRL